MNTCDKCKWFNPIHHPYKFPNLDGDEHGECAHVKIDARLDNTVHGSSWPDDSLYVEGVARTNEDAYLFVGPKFGCIHFQEKS